MGLIQRREFSHSRYWANRAATVQALAEKMAEGYGQRRMLNIAADYRARAEHFRQLEDIATASSAAQS